MDNSERDEALKPQTFTDADVFYGLYDSDVTTIPNEKEKVKNQVENLLKIKDLNERQYTALAVYEEVSLYLSRDMGRCDVMSRWFDDAVSSYSIALMMFHPLKMTSTERAGIARCQYSVVGKKIDVLRSAIAYWKEQVSILKNILYSVRNNIDLMKEGLL
jgi:hypothetical protein